MTHVLGFQPTAADNRTRDALRSVIQERVRQESLWGVQHHGFGAPEGLSDLDEQDVKDVVAEHVAAGTLTWFDILGEELVEAAVAALFGDLSKVREELVQVAAVAVAAVEDIDSQEEQPMGEYVEIDGKFVWASTEEIEEARAQGSLDEGESELEFGGGEEPADGE